MSLEDPLPVHLGLLDELSPHWEPLKLNLQTNNPTTRLIALGGAHMFNRLGAHSRCFCLLVKNQSVVLIELLRADTCEEVND